MNCEILRDKMGRERAAAERHLEDVGGIGQRGRQDSGHDAAEDVDDHGFI